MHGSEYRRMSLPILSVSRKEFALVSVIFIPPCRFTARKKGTRRSVHPNFHILTDTHPACSHIVSERQSLVYRVFKRIKLPVYFTTLKGKKSTKIAYQGFI